MSGSENTPVSDLSTAPDRADDETGRHAIAAEILGETRATRIRLGSLESERANRVWWDADTEDYHRTHGEFLGVDTPEGEFVWCPEGLHEADVQLLGPVAGRDVLELGCGSAPCTRWLAGQGARAVGLDISAGMLQRGLAAMAASGRTVPLVQAGAENLPFADASFDIVCSAFGAVPFVADSGRVMREVARVLRPGGRWVFSVNHPMRWIFPDDPGEHGLIAMFPYFDRTPYVEVDPAGRPTYAEHHRTVGDRVRELVAAGLEVYDIVEPEWPDHLDREWGQWSPLRGSVFPGTAIFCSRKPR
ncbi:class I SAM-dependent methyltransferase [Rhodococcus sp. CH91]|uniref:class I SAM-dependent methyltransferase n=1 Tax=Rhodococcus sp. CH91 TaxID=2910256 RepID=UPI001F4B42F7|nr:class I SAM-dependent methyltransferase [Rhodococcus sp. CH91]